MKKAKTSTKYLFKGGKGEIPRGLAGKFKKPLSISIKFIERKSVKKMTKNRRRTDKERCKSDKKQQKM